MDVQGNRLQRYKGAQGFFLFFLLLTVYGACESGEKQQAYAENPGGQTYQLSLPRVWISPTTAHGKNWDIWGASYAQRMQWKRQYQQLMQNARSRYCWQCPGQSWQCLFTGQAQSSSPINVSSRGKNPPSLAYLGSMKVLMAAMNQKKKLGHPDPRVEVESHRNAKKLLFSAQQDTFSPSWKQAQNIALMRGDRISVNILDQDRFGADDVIASFSFRFEPPESSLKCPTIRYIHNDQDLAKEVTLQFINPAIQVAGTRSTSKLPAQDGQQRSAHQSVPTRVAQRATSQQQTRDIDAHIRPERKGIGRIYALLIGINNYAGTGIASLGGAAHDAWGLQEVLLNKSGVHADHIVVIPPRGSNPSTYRVTNAEIRRHIQFHLSQAGPEDYVFFLFSGHGKAVRILDPDKKEYRDYNLLLTSEFSRDKLRKITDSALYKKHYLSQSRRIQDDFLSAQEISEDLERLRAKGRIVVIDACESGALKGSRNTAQQMANAMGGGSGRVIFSSSRASQLSVEIQKKFPGLPWKGYGALAFSIMEGLSGKARDLDEDGILDHHEIFRYVRKRVRQLALRYQGRQQEPVLRAAITDPIPMGLSPKQRRYGFLTLDSQPSGATVLIEGTDSGQTPLRKYKLKAGTYQVTVQKSGYIRWRRSIQIQAQQNTMQTTILQREKLGTVELISDPVGASIKIDGESQGNTPQKLRLLEGIHQVVIELAGRRSWQQNIQVLGEQTRQFRIYLQPLQRTLFLQSHPPGVEVRIQGRVVGSTPLRIPVNQTHTTVTLSKQGYLCWQKSIQITTEGTEAKEEVHLESSPSVQEFEQYKQAEQWLKQGKYQQAISLYRMLRNTIRGPVPEWKLLAREAYAQVGIKQITEAADLLKRAEKEYTAWKKRLNRTGSNMTYYMRMDAHQAIGEVYWFLAQSTSGSQRLSLLQELWMKWEICDKAQPAEETWWREVSSNPQGSGLSFDAIYQAAKSYKAHPYHLHDRALVLLKYLSQHGNRDWPAWAHLRLTETALAQHNWRQTTQLAQSFLKNKAYRRHMGRNTHKRQVKKIHLYLAIASYHLHGVAAFHNHLIPSRSRGVQAQYMYELGYAQQIAGDNKGAIVSYEAALSKMSSSLHSGRYNLSWRLGFLYLVEGRFKDAYRMWLPLYEKTFAKIRGILPVKGHVERDEYHVFIHWLDLVYWLARAAEQSGDTTQAQEKYKFLCEKFPLNLWGMNSCRRLGKTYSPHLPARPLEQWSRWDDDWKRYQYYRCQNDTDGASLVLMRRLYEQSVPDPGLVILTAKTLARQGHWGYSFHILKTHQLKEMFEGKLPRSLYELAFPRPPSSWPLIQKAADEARLDPLFLAAMIRRESDFTPDLRFAARVGMMQLDPIWANTLPIDLQANLKMGATRLAQLKHSFSHLSLAMAAYRRFTQNVKRAASHHSSTEPDVLLNLGHLESPRAYTIDQRSGTYWYYQMYRWLYAK